MQRSAAEALERARTEGGCLYGCMAAGRQPAHAPQRDPGVGACACRGWVVLHRFSGGCCANCMGCVCVCVLGGGGGGSCGQTCRDVPALGWLGQGLALRGGPAGLSGGARNFGRCSETALRSGACRGDRCGVPGELPVACCAQHACGYTPRGRYMCGSACLPAAQTGATTDPGAADHAAAAAAAQEAADGRAGAAPPAAAAAAATAGGGVQTTLQLSAKEQVGALMGQLCLGCGILPSTCHLALKEARQGLDLCTILVRPLVARGSLALHVDCNWGRGFPWLNSVLQPSAGSVSYAMHWGVLRLLDVPASLPYPTSTFFCRPSQSFFSYSSLPCFLFVFRRSCLMMTTTMKTWTMRS
jgi:hypothetical protein